MEIESLQFLRLLRFLRVVRFEAAGRRLDAIVLPVNIDFYGEQEK
jgi:hypothetical protein